MLPREWIVVSDERIECIKCPCRLWQCGRSHGFLEKQQNYHNSRREMRVGQINICSWSRGACVTCEHQLAAWTLFVPEDQPPPSPPLQPPLPHHCEGDLASNWWSPGLPRLLHLTFHSTAIVSIMTLGEMTCWAIFRNTVVTLGRFPLQKKLDPLEVRLIPYYSWGKMISCATRLEYSSLTVMNSISSYPLKKCKSLKIAFFRLSPDPDFSWKVFFQVKSVYCVHT